MNWLTALRTGCADASEQRQAAEEIARLQAEVAAGKEFAAKVDELLLRLQAAEKARTT